jgi:hypothetical protein
MEDMYLLFTVNVVHDSFVSHHATNVHFDVHFLFSANVPL